MVTNTYTATRMICPSRWLHNPGWLHPHARPQHDGCGSQFAAEYCSPPNVAHALAWSTVPSNQPTKQSSKQASKQPTSYHNHGKYIMLATWSLQFGLNFEFLNTSMGGDCCACVCVRRVYRGLICLIISRITRSAQGWESAC